MKFLTFLGLALVAPTVAIRKHARRHTVDSVDCDALADLTVKGKAFGKTLELMCNKWPSDKMGEFPVADVGRAGDLLGKLLNEGGVWEQIGEIRADRKNRGFCWKNTTVRDESTGKCPLGYMRSGLTGLFTRSCRTGCRWSSHPVSCGMACAENRKGCAKTILKQSLTVVEGVSSVYGFLTGDDSDTIKRALAAVTTLAEFLMDALPPLVEIVKGAIDVVKEGEDAVMIAVLLFQYAQEHAGDVKETVGSIREAIRHFADLIAELAKEQRETGSIDTGSLIQGILDHGEDMLEYGVRVAKVFTHPTCDVTANVAFTIENVGDDRLQGPWVQRGEINRHPRYTLVGDRSTNVEWSNRGGGRWVMFSDGWSGVFGRKFLYESNVRSSDYPLSGWSLLNGDAPVPEFVAVQERDDE